MLSFVLAAIIGFVSTELIGFAVHRLAHWRGSRRLFHDHLEHHSKFYPPSRYTSERYLGDLRTSFMPWMVAVFALLDLFLISIVHWKLFVPFFVAQATVGLLNNLVHDSFHVDGHWMARFAWHRRLKEKHRIHHENVRVNLGIYWSFFDRILGSSRRSDGA